MGSKPDISGRFIRLKPLHERLKPVIDTLKLLKGFSLLNLIADYDLFVWILPGNFTDQHSLACVFVLLLSIDLVGGHLAFRAQRRSLASVFTALPLVWAGLICVGLFVPARTGYASVIPGLQIPADVYSPEVGRDDFDIYTTSYYEQGGWILALCAQAEAVIPIPAGWSTDDTGKGTYIFFYPEGYSYQSVTIRVAHVSDERRDRSGDDAWDEVWAELDNDVSTDPNMSLLDRGSIDENRAFFLFDMEHEGKAYYFLGAYAEFTSKFQPGDDSLYFLTFLTGNKEDWPTYFTVFQAMLENLADLDLNVVGFQLPDRLAHPENLISQS